MKSIKTIVLALVTMLLVSCGVTRTVPLTGRQQNLIVSDEQVLSLSNQEYRKFMSTAVVSSNAANTAMVKRVGRRLADAVEAYFRFNGLSEELNHYSWEFNLVASNQVNAFCMPGGKIVVYEGLLPYTQNEDALAVVLGHEIAHAVARHSAEQMSKQIKDNLGVQILGGALGALGVNSSVTQIAKIVAQQGLQFSNLKYSRDHESEADKMGIIFAAMAGYDPREAIPFWQRMSAGKAEKSDFFSSHPSDRKRIVALQREMPMAMAYYKGKATPTSKKPFSHRRHLSSEKQQNGQSVSLSDLYKSVK